MKSFVGKLVDRVKDETVKPAPTEYPPLLPTLQTWVGMVTNNGHPQMRTPYLPQMSEQASKTLRDQTTTHRSRCQDLSRIKARVAQATIETNLEACSMPVMTKDLLDYVRQGKRVDTEQAVAMVISYLARLDPSPAQSSKEVSDDFESRDTSIVDDLINDPGTIDMLTNTYMWRELGDYDLLEDPREASIIAKKNKILHLLGEEEDSNALPGPDFIALLQTLRRKRRKLADSQYLTMPKELLPEDLPEKEPWTFDHSYRRGKQDNIPIADARIVPQNLFRKIQQILYYMQKPTDVTALYVFDAERFIKSSGALSPRRLAALKASTDPYTIAYSFIAAQRRRQLKVVSDQGWSRFLVKGEGKLLLQNRPDVLTSFEDVLVRRASDLVALTAVACPKGIRDHFSNDAEIKDRARGVCELMERYVKDFGHGKMDNLTFSKDQRGGSGRGPVDVYNALCDELRDCRARARAAGTELDTGPVHKFLAKDIMASNRAWADDAFAGGKVPGWVEYLARVRAEEMSLGESIELVCM